MIPEGQCGRCHEPHSSANPRMLRQPAGRLCQGCHEGKTRSFHEAKGFSIYVCAKCHDLHRPTQPHLIMDASRSLCTECHDFRAEAVFTHSFVAEGKCFLCHSFHEASLSGDVAALCLGCHRDNPRLPAGAPRRRDRALALHELPPAAPGAPRQAAARRGAHPVQGALLRAVPSRPRREDRTGLRAPVRRLPPRQGHRGRAGRGDGPPALPRQRLQQLPPQPQRGDGRTCSGSPRAPLCLGCHRKMRKSMLITPVSAHSAMLEGRCGSCHDPHFSANPTLLRKPQSDLCRSCHAALVQSPGGGPWAVGHKPVDERKCRLCHRSHTSTNDEASQVAAAAVLPPLPRGVLRRGRGGRHAPRSHKPVREGACAACHEMHGGRSPGSSRTARAVRCAGAATRIRPARITSSPPPSSRPRARSRRSRPAAACTATCRTQRRSAGSCWRPATAVCQGCHNIRRAVAVQAMLQKRAGCSKRSRCKADDDPATEAGSCPPQGAGRRTTPQMGLFQRPDGR